MPTKPKERSDEEINIAIALTRGWRWEEPFNKRKRSNRLIGPKFEVVTVWNDGLLGGAHLLPNCCRSLDAMALAEATLTDEQHEKYRIELQRVIGSTGLLMTKARYREWFSASARQRATAFLATIQGTKKI